jgi:hypothetical protein
VKLLKDDRLNRILDGEEPIEGLPEELLRDYRVYREAITLYRIRCEYVPSERLMRKILKKRRKKLVLSTVFAGIAVSLLLLSVVLDIFPVSPSRKVVQKQNPVVKELIDYIKTVEVVSDGW